VSGQPVEITFSRSAAQSPPSSSQFIGRAKANFVFFPFPPVVQTRTFTESICRSLFFCCFLIGELFSGVSAAPVDRAHKKKQGGRYCFFKQIPILFGRVVLFMKRQRLTN
jgi:hypothetical protein